MHDYIYETAGRRQVTYELAMSHYPEMNLSNSKLWIATCVINCN